MSNDLVIRDDDNDQQEFGEFNEFNEFDDQEQSPLTQLLQFDKPGNVILLAGRQGSGKTNAVRWSLFKHTVDLKIYEVVLVFTQTKFDGEYDFLPDDMVVEGYNEGVLRSFLQVLSSKIDKEKGISAPRNAIVFDDLIGLLSKQDPFLVNFFGTLRHFGTDVYLPVQHINTGSSTILRNITTHSILFNSKQMNTIKSMFENFGLLFEKIDDFKELFFDITSQPFTAMLYVYDIDNRDDNYLEVVFPDMTEFNNIKLEF